MSESIHDKLGRVRKPRVHISYKVEENGAVVTKELPFVVGVLGDFSGNPTEKLPSLKDRKFIEINRDNFDKVLKGMTPGLNLKVDNTLAGDGSQLGVNLKFESIEDFSPERVAEQVEPIRRLLKARQELHSLQAKKERNEKLEAGVENILQEGNIEKLAEKLGVSGDDAGDDDDSNKE